ncbi:MAG: hypothetical protein IAF38_02780 [Bacteroidia bacterium]|nr:hypothetical protein [Bacteroidia bacterium]
MYNLFAYILYLSLVLFVVIFVGRFLYNNGRFYLMDIFNDEKLVDSVNRFMYAGYCLVNAGGAFNCLHKTNTFSSYTESVVYVSENTGELLILLGIMHFINMLVLPLLKNVFKSKKVVSKT